MLQRMPRVTTVFAAALALFLPLGRSLPVGLTPAVGIGAGLLSTQTAQAQTIMSLYDSGLEKFQEGDYQGAISDYNKALKIDPKSKIAYFNRGNANSRLKDYKRAISDYSKSLENDPNYESAYYNRGISEYRLKNYQRAIADFTKAMEINPENVSFYVNRGVAKEMIGDLDGACADWKEASFRGDKDSSGWVDDQC